MKIKSLELTHFHNQAALRVDFSDTVTNIYGANGSGKTTILDALHFLLYQKDSKGRSDTSVRPYKSDGQLMHEIETSVKGVFEVNGYEFTLQIVHKEKWTKITGTDERKLTGNTNEFYVDGVPKKQKEYTAFVQEYFMEPWFSLTTNPNTFPELPWQKQRSLLIDLIGDISNDDVFEANPELQQLEIDLQRYTPEELKKKLDNEIKGYKQIIEEVPARIDELTKSLSDITDPELQRKQAEIILLQAQKPLEELQAKRAAVINGTAVSDLANKVQLLESKMDVIRGIRREKIAKVQEPFKAKAAEIGQQCDNAAAQLRILRPQMASVERQLAEAEDMKKTLIETWRSIDEEVFSDTECPCCHRPYTEDMLQPMLEQFNLSKAERIERCNADGIKIADKIRELKQQKSELLAKINELSSFEVEKAPNLRFENLQAMQAAVDKVAPVEDFIHPETHEKFYDLFEQVKLRNRELDDAKLDVNLHLQKIDKEIEEAKKPVDEAQQTIIRIKMDVETRERIEQLKSKKKNAMLQQGDCEQKLNLLNRFIVAKIDMLTESINNLFPNVSFKLFEKNIGNEGIKETCEITMHGVPYRQLSFAEKHIAGMEIIKVISNKMNIANPVFIDNRESISQLPEAPGQLINLIVSAENRRLKIENV